MAAEPYHDFYSDADIVSVNRSDSELENGHPFLKSLIDEQIESKHYKIDYRRNSIIKAYMGLVKQIDDQIGRLIEFLEESGLRESTIIVFGADHGDHLGDHWLGEKFLFYESGIRVPLIFNFPDSHNWKAGTRRKELVESIDIIPTFIDLYNGHSFNDRLEGKSLLPLITDSLSAEWRDFAVCELNYAFLNFRVSQNIPVVNCYSWMIRTMDWKYIKFIDLPPQLFDLINDPNELNDLGTSAEHQDKIEELDKIWRDWMHGRKLNPTLDYETVESNYRQENYIKMGLLIGFWDESEVPDI